MSGAFAFKNESAKKDSRGPDDGALREAAERQPREAAPAPAQLPPSKSDALAAMAALAAHQPVRHKPKHDPKRPDEKGEFVPGKKPTPRSGQTVHEMMKDHEVLGHLHGKVKEWEGRPENKNRKLKGPDVHAMMGGKVSHGQATRLAQKIHQKHQEFLQSKVQAYYGRGAKNALGSDA